MSHDSPSLVYLLDERVGNWPLYLTSIQCISAESCVFNECRLFSPYRARQHPLRLLPHQLVGQLHASRRALQGGRDHQPLAVEHAPGRAGDHGADVRDRGEAAFGRGGIDCVEVVVDQGLCGRFGECQ